MKYSLISLKYVMTIFLFAYVTSASAQDVFVFELEKNGEKYSIDEGINITKRTGYDNQPSFTPDGKAVLYTSQHGENYDIYEYVIATGITRNLTNTPKVNEYTPIANAANTHFTVVTENTMPDQSVWRYERATGKAAWALSTKEGVGYYCFNRQGVCLIWLRYGNSVVLTNPASVDPARFISGNALPSRPQVVPSTEKFSFVHRQANDEVWIKQLDPKDYSITPIAPVIPNRIDYCWTPDGVLLMGDGSKIFQWRPGKSTAWEQVEDLADQGVQNITRLFFSPDSKKIALTGDDNLKN